MRCGGYMAWPRPEIGLEPTSSSTSQDRTFSSALKLMLKALFSRGQEPHGARPQSLRFCLEQPEEVTHQPFRQKEQPGMAFPKSFQLVFEQKAKRLSRQPWATLASDLLQSHTAHTWTRCRTLGVNFFLVGGLPRTPESSASSSYCLRSPNLLKVFQECGGLTHSLPWVHSLKFTKPLSPLVILIQTSAHMLHRWSWQEEPRDTFFAQDVKVDEELRRSRRDYSPGAV